MKKFIAVIAAIASIAASTSIANAGGTNAPGGSTTAANLTSVFNGSVSGTCSLTVVDGALPTNQTFGPVGNPGLRRALITQTGTEGSIKTVCNTTGSTLRVELEPGTFPPQPNYTQLYRLTSGTGAYDFAGPTAATRTRNPGNFAALPVVYTNLSNAFSTTESELKVLARAEVPVTQVLAAGNYTINVKATVTP